ncbi:hypothetical protein B0H13DRAFT_1894907 [Mycena leptocephala]|nr:hypothetical protein B0H13DRAFT_1894907 [Mycena leptocephala]
MHPDLHLEKSSLLPPLRHRRRCAFTIAVPTNPTSGEVTEINGTFTANDPPTFNLFLTNSTSAFDLKEIIGQNLQTNLGQIHMLLPTLLAMNVDIILAASPPFAITA